MPSGEMSPFCGIFSAAISCFSANLERFWSALNEGGQRGVRNTACRPSRGTAP